MVSLKLGRIKDAFSWAFKKVRDFVKRASDSVEHIKAIEQDIGWFVAQYEDLSPEIKDKVINIQAHLLALKKLWGIE